MKKRCGFSLAEALITLLIVAIIAMVSVPVITKKKKSPRSASELLWNADRELPAITPAGSRDIRLGNTSTMKTQGIIVVERLEFKNRQGEVIGWIEEDGESSFTNTQEIIKRQNEILKILQNLTGNINGIINSGSSDFDFNDGSDSKVNDGKTGRERLERKKGKVNDGLTGRERLMRKGTGRDRLNRKNSGNNYNYASVTPEQIEQISSLQKQLQEALQNR